MKMKMKMCDKYSKKVLLVTLIGLFTFYGHFVAAQEGKTSYTIIKNNQPTTLFSICSLFFWVFSSLFNLLEVLNRTIKDLHNLNNLDNCIQEFMYSTYCLFFLTVQNYQYFAIEESSKSDKICETQKIIMYETKTLKLRFHKQTALKNVRKVMLNRSLINLWFLSKNNYMK